MERKEHGRMKTVLHCNEAEKDTIPHSGHKIEEAEGDADPGINLLLEVRDTKRVKAPML